MKEIVGGRVGTLITNNFAAIREASRTGTLTDLYDREQMRFMADMDLGRNWELMASGPTLFCLDDDGKPHAPNVKLTHRINHEAPQLVPRPVEGTVMPQRLIGESDESKAAY